MLYQRGDYQSALQSLSTSLRRLPAFEPYLFYYVPFCERVLAVKLTAGEHESMRSQSFADEAFHEEFEQDYEPVPRCNRRNAIG